MFLFLFLLKGAFCTTALDFFSEDGDRYMRVGCVMLKDAYNRHHHLTALAKQVAIGIDAAYWSNARWFYDREKRQLRNFADTHLRLSADSINYTLRFANGSDIDPNDAFIYDDVNLLIYWINPSTKEHHPIYLEKGCDVHRVVFHPKISRNPVSRSMSDYIHKFAGKQLSNAYREHLRARALTLVTLQRAIPKLTETEYQKYLNMILGYNEMKFDYFLTDQNEYLLADGNTVTTIKIDALRKFNYKYHALWSINEKNQLIHFLSGKYLQAFEANKSVKIFIPITMFNETLHNLKLSAYFKEIDDNFVTVRQRNGKHELYINKNGTPHKIKNTFTNGCLYC